MPALKRLLVAPVLAALIVGSATAASTSPIPAPVATGSLTTFDDAFKQLLIADASIEKLAEGFTWSEGPTWVGDGNYLLFNDVPQNTMYRWSEQDGLSVLLKPSGYDGPDDGTLREGGANGLHADANGKVLLADSGTRVVARLDPRTKQKTTLASHFQGKRFNSPNDVIQRSDGVVFFTDPPYGLKDMNDSPVKELAFNGVYRLDTDGSVHLLDDSLSLPNGIALSPDERTLYVANSDQAKPIWMAYTLDACGQVIDKRVFADATDLMGEGIHGLPDGIAISTDGKLFATGPGGVLVFDPTGKRLGRIETGSAVANVSFGGEDGKTLYMTSHNFLARLRLNAQGLGFTR